jgi:lipopolysaccharide/colanic/teichoic acid biosynthesis glycosyltransferase
VARRALDVLASAIGLVLLSPVFAAVALVIAATSPGPVFFRQVRVGRGGEPFRIYKFRSMRVDAEALGGQLTVRGDPRVTRVGALLRASKIDELPQLINVLVGDMSLVGPRPEVPRYVALYTPEQRRVLEVRPGITDPASIRYRDESAVLARAADPERAYVEEVLPHKLAINLAYLDRRSLTSDVGVILATVWRLLRRSEA